MTGPLWRDPGALRTSNNYRWKEVMHMGKADIRLIADALAGCKWRFGSTLTEI